MREAILSENSNVKLGLVVAALGLVAAFAFGAVWWAAALQTKVDSLLTMTAANAVTNEAVQERIVKLEMRILVLEQKAKP